MYGTPIGAHTSGGSFARFGPNDPSLFRYRYPASFIGQTLYLKLPGFNMFGQALQDLSGLTATTYTLTGDGAAAAPAYVSGACPARRRLARSSSVTSLRPRQVFRPA